MQCNGNYGRNPSTLFWSNDIEMPNRIDHIYMVYPQSDSFIIEMAKNCQKIIVSTVRCDRSRLENVPIAQEISDMLDIG